MARPTKAPTTPPDAPTTKHDSSASISTKTPLASSQPAPNAPIIEAVHTATMGPIGTDRSPGQKPNGRGPLGYRVHSIAQGVITPCLVEVAGIEPASSDALTGLLRAQYARPLLDPTSHAYELVRRAQSL